MLRILRKLFHFHIFDNWTVYMTDGIDIYQKRGCLGCGLIKTRSAFKAQSIFWY